MIGRTDGRTDAMLIDIPTEAVDRGIKNEEKLQKSRLGKVNNAIVGGLFLVLWACYHRL